MDVDKKRELADAIAEAGARAYGFERDSMILLIKENEPENAALGGTLICDRE
ncbi:MAG: tautomerase family protein [Candidatus Coatesbacteria bacterium]|nr:MAG: tautomerase family protein [Candidatus Coatesbacteria bacterium]